MSLAGKWKRKDMPEQDFQYSSMLSERSGRRRPPAERSALFTTVLLTVDYQYSSSRSVRCTVVLY